MFSKELQDCLIRIKLCRIDCIYMVSSHVWSQMVCVKTVHEKNFDSLAVNSVIYHKMLFTLVSLVILSAQIWLLASVMNFKTTALCEKFTTLATHIWSPSRLSYLMCLRCCFVKKAMSHWLHIYDHLE